MSSISLVDKALKVVDPKRHLICWGCKLQSQIHNSPLILIFNVYYKKKNLTCMSFVDKLVKNSLISKRLKYENSTYECQRFWF